MNTGKNCKKCGEFKLWEELVKNKSCKDNYENICKICCKKYKKQYYINNIDKFKIDLKEYRENNSDKIKELKKQYYINNSDKVKNNHKQYYKNNSDKVKETVKEYRINNPDKIRESYNKWRSNNLHIYNTIQAKRRALKLQQLHPNHNRKIEITLREMSKRLQNCLGIQFHVDHIIPLSRGGPHHHQNLQVIPAILNNQKNANMNFEHPLLINPKNILPIFENWMKSSEQFAK